MTIETVTVPVTGVPVQANPLPGDVPISKPLTVVGTDPVNDASDATYVTLTSHRGTAEATANSYGPTVTGSVAQWTLPATDLSRTGAIGIRLRYTGTNTSPGYGGVDGGQLTVTLRDPADPVNNTTGWSIGTQISNGNVSSPLLALDGSLQDLTIWPRNVGSGGWDWKAALAAGSVELLLYLENNYPNNDFSDAFPFDASMTLYEASLVFERGPAVIPATWKPPVRQAVLTGWSAYTVAAMDFTTKTLDIFTPQSPTVPQETYDSSGGDTVMWPVPGDVFRPGAAWDTASGYTGYPLGTVVGTTDQWGDGSEATYVQADKTQVQVALLGPPPGSEPRGQVSGSDVVGGSYTGVYSFTGTVFIRATRVSTTATPYLDWELWDMGDAAQSISPTLLFSATTYSSVTDDPTAWWAGNVYVPDQTALQAAWSAGRLGVMVTSSDLQGDGSAVRIYEVALQVGRNWSGQVQAPYGDFGGVSVLGDGSFWIPVRANANNLMKALKVPANLDFSQAQEWSSTGNTIGPTAQYSWSDYQWTTAVWDPVEGVNWLDWTYPDATHDYVWTAYDDNGNALYAVADDQGNGHGATAGTYPSNLGVATNGHWLYRSDGYQVTRYQRDTGVFQGINLPGDSFAGNNADYVGYCDALDRMVLTTGANNHLGRGYIALVDPTTVPWGPVPATGVWPYLDLTNATFYDFRGAGETPNYSFDQGNMARDGAILGNYLVYYAQDRSLEGPDDANGFATGLTGSFWVMDLRDGSVAKIADMPFHYYDKSGAICDSSSQWNDTSVIETGIAAVLGPTRQPQGRWNVIGIGD